MKYSAIWILCEPPVKEDLGLTVMFKCPTCWGEGGGDIWTATEQRVEESVNLEIHSGDWFSHTTVAYFWKLLIFERGISRTGWAEENADLHIHPVCWLNTDPCL